VKSSVTKRSAPPSSLSDACGISDPVVEPASGDELARNWARETKRVIKTMLGKSLFAGHETAYPVAIRWTKMPDDEWGDAGLKDYKVGRRFIIRLNKDLLKPDANSRDLAMFIFCHELAHCLAYGSTEAAEESRTRVHGDHGAVWSVEYGALYESLFD